MNNVTIFIAIDNGNNENKFVLMQEKHMLSEYILIFNI